MISAEILADSINTAGQRITSFKLVMPRIVLAEFNTHRAISRNSASSRAIPFKRMVQMVKDNPFIPMKWMKDHKGMQGNEFFEDFILCNILEKNWLKARDAAVEQAEMLAEIGLTKQHVNRLLEAYMYHTVIATATDWENFFALRAHPDAEIHIQDLAYKMLDLYNTNTPKFLSDTEWHIPFGDKFDEGRLKELALEWTDGQYSSIKDLLENDPHVITSMKVAIATARCARVSYMNFEGKDDYTADSKLHDTLSTVGHWSPFEHCAYALSNIRSGNFNGFIQYRKTFEGENKTDNRVIKKYAN